MDTTIILYTYHRKNWIEIHQFFINWDGTKNNTMNNNIQNDTTKVIYRKKKQYWLHIYVSNFLTPIHMNTILPKYELISILNKRKGD